MLAPPEDNPQILSAEVPSNAVNVLSVLYIGSPVATTAWLTIGSGQKPQPVVPSSNPPLASEVEVARTRVSFKVLFR